MSNTFELYRFNPQALSFTLVGRLDCLDGTKFEEFDTNAYSIGFQGIAVSRDGRGWLGVQRNHGSVAGLGARAVSQPNERFIDSALVQFSTADGACTVGNFEQVATNAEASKCLAVALGTLGKNNSSCTPFNKRFLRALTVVASPSEPEELYGSNAAFNTVLFTVDPSTASRSEKGVLLEQENTYLTSLAGTNDGRMFAAWMHAGSDKMRYSISNIDWHAASTSPFETIDFDSIRFEPTAMTFWGGDLWFFGLPTSADGNVDSKKIQVVRYGLETKTPTVMIDDVGDAIKKSEGSKGNMILGAANSPCAPLAVPK